VSATSAGAARTLRVSADVAGNPNAIAASSSAASVPGNADNAVILSQLALGPVVGTRSASAAYGDLVGDVGSRKAASADDVTMRQSVADQMTAMRESASGVSLDEEMVAMSKYQRAYEASSKLISTVDQLLQELIDRIG
jgi:flagellar hook-associated protein 1 FlgK